MDLAGLYRDVVEGSPDGIWVIDLDGRTVHANAAMARLYGVSPEEMAEVSMYDIVDDLGRAQLDEHLRQVREGRVNDDEVEVQVVRTDGTLVWCLVRESLVEIEPGRPGLCTVFSDYTTRREIVQALRSSRRSLAEAQRIARIGSWEWDLTSDTITGSQEVDAMFGSSTATQPWGYERFLDQVHPEDQPIVEEAVETAIGEGGSFDVTVRVLADEQWMWTRGRGVVHHDRDGRLLLSGTLQDVTEVVETRIALEDQVTQNTLMQAVASAANAASNLDELLLRARELVLLHDDWERAVGFRYDDGRLVPIALPGEAPDPAREERELALAHRALEQRAPVWDEARLTIAFPVLLDEEVLAVVTITSAPPLFRHAMIQQMVLHVADQMARVAWRERTAAELERARDGAMEASRMKSDFLATMSHEIRTPLNGVIGLNDLLLRTGLDPDQQRLAAGVQVASRALLGVLNDILDFSKIEAGHLDLEVLDFEVREVVEQVVGVLGESARAKGLELVVSCAPEVPRMLAGDPTRLAQVLTNLVSNAVKFTEEGEVVVRATAEPGPGPEEGTVLRIAVSDTGIGVSADKVEALFEPFTQADTSTTRVYGGTGLGLAICREIVQAMGGTISHHDNPGGGSVFVVTVLLPPSASTLDDSADQHARSVLGGRRVLVVDDNPHNRTILAEQLGWWGVRAVTVDSAVEALAAVRSAALRGLPFEAVLLDMAMPHHDGLWLARRLRTEPGGGDMRLLLLTSLTEVSRQEVEEAGIDDLVVKPVPSGVLRTTVLHLLDDGGAGAGTGRRPGPAGARLDPTPGASSPSGGRRVLVVEDNPVNQMVAAGILEFLGYDHHVVDDGREGLAAWAAGEWDAILMDVQMPVLDGYAATRALREQEAERPTRRRTPVIAMTAAAVDGERERCLAAGMDDYLTKPVDPAALAATLSHWLEGTPVEHDTPTSDAGADTAVAPEQDGLDTERLDMLLDLDPGSTAYLDRAIGNFMRNSVSGMDDIRAAIAAGDAAALRHSSHKLAGGALNLGVGYAGEAVRLIEAIADTGTTEGAEALLGQAEEALARGREALAAYQERYRAELGAGQEQ